MKKSLTIALAAVGAAAAAASIPRVVNYLMLHGTGTVVRDQKGWM